MTTFILAPLAFIVGEPLYASSPVLLNDLKKTYIVNSDLEIFKRDENLANPAAQFVPYDEKKIDRFSPEPLWARFSIDNTFATPQSLLLSNEFQIADMAVVGPGLVSQPKLFGGSNLAANYWPSFYPTAKIEIPPGLSTFYLRYNQMSQPLMISLMLRGDETYKSYVDHQTVSLFIVLGIYIGAYVYNFVLIILIRSRLQYASLFIISLLFVYSSLLRGIPFFFNLDHVSIFLNQWLPVTAVGEVAICLYLLDVFVIDRKNDPLTYRLLKTTGLICTLLTCTYYAFPYASIVIFLPFALLSGTMLIAIFVLCFKKDNLLGTLLVLTFIPLISLLIEFGLAYLNYIPYQPKVIEQLFGCGAYMSLLMAVSLGIRIQRDNKQAAQTEQAIMMGRSVQDLLMPTKTLWEHERFSIIQQLEPHKNSMSGDWINIWEERDGAVSMMLGDVTGKGPQAAIAVAAIASVIDRAGRDGCGVENTIHEINRTLFSLFAGKLTTTICAAIVRPDGNATLYNAGGVGWLAVRQGDSRYLCRGGDLLGTDQTVSMNQYNWQLMHGDLLVTITDGVCEGSSAIRRLLRRLETAGQANHDIFAYREVVLSTPRKIEDDRGLLLIMAPGGSGQEKPGSLRIA